MSLMNDSCEDWVERQIVDEDAVTIEVKVKVFGEVVMASSYSTTDEMIAETYKMDRAIYQDLNAQYQQNAEDVVESEREDGRA